MSYQEVNSETKVRDYQKVREILDSYEWDNVEIELVGDDTTGTLDMTFRMYDPEEFDWPKAIHRSQWPNRDHYADDNAHNDACHDLFDDQGEDGFQAMLRELAPYLESPLQIPTACSECGEPTMKTWTFQTGSDDVKAADASSQTVTLKS